MAKHPLYGGLIIDGVSSHMFFMTLFLGRSRKTQLSEFHSKQWKECIFFKREHGILKQGMLFCLHCFAYGLSFTHLSSNRFTIDQLLFCQGSDVTKLQVHATQIGQVDSHRFQLFNFYEPGIFSAQSVSLLFGSNLSQKMMSLQHTLRILVEFGQMWALYSSNPLLSWDRWCSMFLTHLWIRDTFKDPIRNERVKMHILWFFCRTGHWGPLASCIMSPIYQRC